MAEESTNDFDAVTDFATYEEFLDDKIEDIDRYYLEVKHSTYTCVIILRLLIKRIILKSP